MSWGNEDPYEKQRKQWAEIKKKNEEHLKKVKKMHEEQDLKKRLALKKRKKKLKAKKKIEDERKKSAELDKLINGEADDEDKEENEGAQDMQKKNWAPPALNRGFGHASTAVANLKPQPGLEKDGDEEVESREGDAGVEANMGPAIPTHFRT